jgi:hypothetical protein
LKKTIGRYIYEIDENNAVRMWDIECPNEEDKPFFYQPDHPDATPWESAEAAENWTVNFINKLLTPPQEPTE